MIVRNRHHLETYLTEQMVAAYKRRTKRGRELIKTASGPVKSYVVDTGTSQVLAPGQAGRARNGGTTADAATSDPSENGASLEELLRPLVKSKELAAYFAAEIYPGEDEDVVTISGSCDRWADVSFFVSATDKRYWIVHTTADNKVADRVVGTLAKEGRFGRVWVPSETLEHVSRMGIIQGLTLAFDRTVFGRVVTEGAPQKVMKMQMQGSQASDLLGLLRQERAFEGCAALASVTVRFPSGAGDGSGLDVGGDNFSVSDNLPVTPDFRMADEFCVANLRYDGKVSAGGTSFASYMSLLTIFKDTYAQHVATLDRAYPLRSEVGARRTEGQLLVLALPYPVADVERFCRTICSASQPFPFWGSPVGSDPGSVGVRAVDLETGTRLDLEVTAEAVRIYLPWANCGGAVMHLFTNLQHHFGSDVRLLDRNGNNVLQH